MKYEVIREIFNQCSNNQMRDVHIEEIEIDDIDSYMDRYRVGSDVREERSVPPDGSIVYEIVANGLRQRVSFTEM